MKTVLVIEDSLPVLALIHEIVAAAGYIVSDASTAEEAFERFDENDASINLLIADVMLDGRSGIDVALELRALLPNLKVIITSGYPKAMWNKQEIAELDELPSDSVAVLQKPFRPAMLLSTIQRMIGLPLRAAPALGMKMAS